MVFAPQVMNDTLVGPLLYHTEVLHSAFASLADPELIFLNVLNGLLGTVTVAYAIFLCWIAIEPFRRGERWAWNAIAMSITVWAMLEGCVKLSDGLGIWSMAHLGLPAAIGIPLMATYHYFHPSAKLHSNETIQSEHE